MNDKEHAPALRGIDPANVAVGGDKKRVLFWASRRGGFLLKPPPPQQAVVGRNPLGYGRHNPFKRGQTVLELVDAGMIEAFTYQPSPARPAEIRYRATPFGLEVLARSRRGNA